MRLQVIFFWYGELELVRTRDRTSKTLGAIYASGKTLVCTSPSPLHSQIIMVKVVCLGAVYLIKI